MAYRQAKTVQQYNYNMFLPKFQVNFVENEVIDIAVRHLDFSFLLA